MAICTPPVALRLGFVFLEYGLVSGVVSHKVAVGLLDAYDPTDLVHIQPSADLWGDLVADVLTNQWRVVGWGTQYADHSSCTATAFGTPKLGTHSPASSAVESYSATVTITGKGIPSAGQCAGQARHVLFTGRTFEFTSGQKSIGNGADGALDILADFLATDLVLWSDFYGQKAGVRGKYPIQFNAAAQQRLGT